MNSLLLIDDQKEFKDGFQTLAQRRGYHLAWGRSFEEMSEKLPSLHDKITAVVLDIKCLITNDQEMENENFIGMALTLLNTKYPSLPKVILTGDEQAFELSRFFPNENIFRKDPEDIERMFEKINEHNANHAERLRTADEKAFHKIIESAEGRQLEFKSSLQYCTKENCEDQSLRFEILKTLSAFSNTEGGTLLIGVQDNKNILGLEGGDFLTITARNKIDAYRLLVDNLIESKFGNGFHSVLDDMKFLTIEGKTICQITVKGKYSSPLFIERKVPNKPSYKAFFIRALASSRELKDEEMNNYIKENWW